MVGLLATGTSRAELRFRASFAASAGWSSNPRLLDRVEHAARVTLAPSVGLWNTDGPVVGWLEADGLVDVPVPHSESIRERSGGRISARIAKRWRALELSLDGFASRRGVSDDPGQPGLSPTTRGGASVAVGAAPGPVMWHVEYRLDASRPDAGDPRDRHSAVVMGGWRLFEHGHFLLAANAHFDLWGRRGGTAAESRTTDLRATTLTAGGRFEAPLGRGWFMSADGDFLARIPSSGAALLTGVGQLRFGVDIGGVALLCLGLARRVEPSLWGDSVTADEASFAGRVRLGERGAGLALELDTEVRYVHGAHLPFEPTTESAGELVFSHRERTEELVTATAGVWLRLAPHWWVGLDWRLETRLSQFRTQLLGESPGGITSELATDGYLEQSVMLGAAWRL